MREPEAPAASSWMDEEEAEERRSLSPVRAFVLLLFVVAFLVGIGLIAMSNKDPIPTDQAIPTTNNFALTDEQAIARFKELNNLRVQAYRTRDTTLIPSYVTEESPLREPGIRDIQKLVARNIQFVPELKTISLEVSDNSATHIRLRETVIEKPKFVDPESRRVLKSGGTIYLVTEWTLRLENGTWKIHDSQVIESRRCDEPTCS